MRPFKFFFGLLFVAAAAFVLLKLLFFVAFGALVLGAVFFGARAFRRDRPGYRDDYGREWSPGEPGYLGRPVADPIDPRAARRPAESLAGGRMIEIL